MVVSVPGPPRPDLLPLLAGAGALQQHIYISISSSIISHLHAAAEVHDVKLHVAQCARLGELHVRLTGQGAGLGRRDVSAHDRLKLAMCCLHCPHSPVEGVPERPPGLQRGTRPVHAAQPRRQPELLGTHSGEYFI